MTPPRHPSYLFGLHRPHTGSEGSILRAPAGRVRARSGAGHRALGQPYKCRSCWVGLTAGRWRSRSVMRCGGLYERSRAGAGVRGCGCGCAHGRACVCVCVCVCICFVFHGFKCVKRIRKQSNKLSRTHNESENNQTIAHSITATANNETIPHGQHRAPAKIA